MEQTRRPGSFFRSRWVDPPVDVEELDPAMLARGFRAGTAHCGLKGGGKTDVGLLVCDVKQVRSSLLLTRNASAAAPVRICRDRVDRDGVRAAVVNAGNANAETGKQGLADAWEMCGEAAGKLGLEPEAVAVAETGVIGVPLPIEAVLAGIGEAAGTLSAQGGAAFSDAILTTDRWPKRCTLQAGGVTISAQAKGGGMIQPKMATMLCFVQTDAVVEDPDATLRAASSMSFERITVDGQMSTNDTVLLQATGEAGAPLPEGLLEAVLLQLAIEVVADGEGSTRVCRVTVDGAASAAEAEQVARAIANSPLVKTALFGRDPNWGRIAQAAGMALVGEDLEEIGADSIDAAELGEDVAEAELGLRLDRGEHSAHVYFSDLGYEYVRINAEYTS
jgi:glutamate N-acetyltransferase / amino-acid N-acetyltransferase